MRIGLAVVITIALLLVGLAGYSSRSSGMPASSDTRAQAEGATVALEAGDLFFDPEVLSVSAGDTIVLSNSGVLEHNFAIEGFNDDAPVDIPIGGSVEWVVPADLAPGTYEFYCAVPGHRSSGMHGTLTVIDAEGEALKPTVSAEAGSVPPESGDEDLAARVSALETQVMNQATQIARLEERLDELEDAAGE